MRTGIHGLDEMMEGGIYSGSNLTIVGMPGAGKTTLGLSFLLEGARQGQEGVYIGFFEKQAHLFRKAENLKMPLREYVNEGKVHIFWQSPHDLIIDELGLRLVKFLRSCRSEEKRVFIDGIESFSMAVPYSMRMPLFFSALMSHLQQCGATTVISKSMSMFSSRELITQQSEYSEQLSESTIMLRYLRNGARMCRFLSIVKMRESPYHPLTKSFQIGFGGMTVCDIDDETHSVLQKSGIQY